MNDHLTNRAESLSQYDVGLRAHFARVYKIMCFGLLITAIVSYATAMTPALFQAVHGTALKWVVMLAPLGIIFFGLNPSNVRRMSNTAVSSVFYLFSGLLGLSMSYIFAVYSGESIAQTFFVTASMFGVMSIWGYTTKRDLSSMGSFLFMGLIGLIIASVVNIFLASTMMAFIISAVGVLVFTLMIAFDTQRIKEMYNANDSASALHKLAVMSALSLYLDIINLFQFLLMFLGNRE
ncbi:MAG: hypothetical protein CMH32_06300 [Micavibrio sp.]|jgi:hypothetical protein|nr:hypothetical protein [Micavibrio sp.]HCK33448.1 hypothetical protein [Rhodospirillaceae bacterium]|tara:strand:+ start:162 stop:869 length:708 start_codon:yes stop_codon:yes gene_type:complete